VADAPAVSPWQAVLGDDLDALPPSLRGYFGAIPAGSTGVGSGVLDVLGTPRRWLWPLLAIVGRGGALFPVWARDVPFEVVNRPVSADGHPAVAATRTFHLPDGDRAMVDLTAAIAGPGGVELADLLGRDRTLRVGLRAAVVDDGLLLVSTTVALRVGPVRIRLPRPLTPRLRLRERVGADGRQHVALTVDLPPIGRLYEYSGSFDYARVEAP
jgi:hypothetical protein